MSHTLDRITTEYLDTEDRTLVRITTEYIDTEDCLRLSGQYADGVAVVIWLTRRLISA